MNKIIVWSLFDDGLMCYNTCLKDNDKYINYSIGIRDNKDIKNYKQIDLSLTNINLIKQLSKLPHPDIIIASPPCESWSRADTSGCIRWSTKENENIWNIRNKKYFNEYHKIRNFMKKEINRVIGEATAGALVLIINHFNPTYWIIENPRLSMIWEYLYKHHDFKYLDNITYYNCYNINSPKKPTNFMSNVWLNLKKENILSTIKWESYIGYDKRSQIPLKLIETIFKNLERQEI